MNRNYLRVAALALSLYLSVAPVVLAAPKKDRTIGDPGTSIVRIVKKLTSFFRGFAAQDEYPVPPRP
jgi:hypothetical protein